jgi:hypothetical protein
VGVEKVAFLQKQPKLGDRKCLGKPRKSFVGHPDAILFLRISREGVFQQPHMFTRNVSFHLKSNMLSDYTRTFEKEILPLLRKQKGFKDEITLSNPGSLDAIAISLWENKANAEVYNSNTYQGVLNTFARMLDGTPKVQTFETVTSTFHNVAVAV